MPDSCQRKGDVQFFNDSLHEFLVGDGETGFYPS